MRSLRQADVLQLDVLQANVGNYDASARYYVRALSLNPQAVNVWGYLRTSLACSGKVELMPAIDEEDLQQRYISHHDGRCDLFCSLRRERITA